MNELIVKTNYLFSNQQSTEIIDNNEHKPIKPNYNKHIHNTYITLNRNIKKKII
jgi:hypothetical protein